MLISCSKKGDTDQPVPQGVLATVTTGSVYSTAPTTAKGIANVTADGGTSVTARGMCFSTTPSPTISNQVISSGSGLGVFNTDFTGLQSSTKYYIRAFATNSAGTTYGNEVSFTTFSSSTLAVGDTYNGGTVAYILEVLDPGYVPGEVHGIIVTQNDQTSAAFGCQGTYINGTEETLGKGQSNTTLLVNGCSDSQTAAKICNDLVLNNYSDWYLPSLKEMDKIYENQSVIPGIADDYYWTSSDFNSTNASLINLTTGYSLDTGKNRSSRVRAIRSF